MSNVTAASIRNCHTYTYTYPRSPYFLRALGSTYRYPMGVRFSSVASLYVNGRMRTGLGGVRRAGIQLNGGYGITGDGAGGLARFSMMVSTTLWGGRSSLSFQPDLMPLCTSQLPPVFANAVLVRNSLSIVPGRRAGVSEIYGTFAHRRSAHLRPRTRHGQTRRP